MHYFAATQSRDSGIGGSDPQWGRGAHRLVGWLKTCVQHKCVQCSHYSEVMPLLQAVVFCCSDTGLVALPHKANGGLSCVAALQAADDDHEESSRLVGCLPKQQQQQQQHLQRQLQQQGTQ